MQLGADAYKQTLSEVKVSADPAVNAMVQRVGTRIAQAAMLDSEDAKKFQWEFTVIEDENTVNAWCLPGGKVAVYTGIPKLTQNEAGLATVLGHEVAHATAHHGAERMTQQMGLEGAQKVLASILETKSPTVSQGVMAALGVGAQLGVVLPFSRKQESEADHIGLVYMSRAGYDPKEALAFWQRMDQAMGSGGTPGFLSDHPVTKDRIADIENWIPEAAKQFGKAAEAGGAAVPVPGAAGS